MGETDVPSLLVVLVVALAAAVTDVREWRIPNLLVGAGVIATAALAVSGGRWLDALAGGGVGMALMALPRLAAREAVGFGDIKLVGIVGLAAGVSGVIAVLCIAVAAATVALLVQAGYRQAIRNLRLPFAPCLALGVGGYLAALLHAGGG